MDATEEPALEANVVEVAESWLLDRTDIRLFDARDGHRRAGRG